jgi:hypothetical protein
MSIKIVLYKSCTYSVYKYKQMNKIKLNHDVIENSDVGGVGGKEKIVQDFFCPSLSVERINHSIYDFIINKNIKVEVKKQQGGQWFDYAKYHNLTVEEENIVMMFIQHKKGKVQYIFGIFLKDFIKIVCNDPEFKVDGWTLDDIKDAYHKKKMYPRLEYKAPLNIPKFYKKYKQDVKLYYNIEDVC